MLIELKTRELEMASVKDIFSLPWLITSQRCTSGLESHAHSLSFNSMIFPFQAPFRKFRSTESAFLPLHNGIKQVLCIKGYSYGT